MDTSKLPRRAVLKLGAALALGLLITSYRPVGAQGAQPAPAQVPRAPEAPDGAALQGTWLWQRTAYGGERPDEAVVRALCEEWLPRFGTREPA